MKVGYSGLTNTIYAGNTKKDSKNREVWTKKHEVTDSAIASVFEWLKSNAVNGGTRYFELEYPNQEGKIIFDLGKNWDKEE